MTLGKFADNQRNNNDYGSTDDEEKAFLEDGDILLPSPNSDDQPSRENLNNKSERDNDYETCQLLFHHHRPSHNNGGLVTSTSEIQLQDFGDQKALDDELLGDSKKRPHRGLLMLTVLLLAILGFGLKTHLKQPPPVIVPPREHDDLPADWHKNSRIRRPFSSLHPVHDLGLFSYVRPDSSTPPSPLTEGPLKDAKNYPTNAWYQNLLMPNGEPEPLHRAYSIPYIVDGAGPIPGLRVHPNHVGASTLVVQLNVIEKYGLTLGAALDAAASSGAPLTMDSISRKYRVTHANPLGVTLNWNSFPMHSTITKGMPYATMRFKSMAVPGPQQQDKILPTILSEIPLEANPVVDGSLELHCGSNDDVKPVLVEREIEVLFQHSDFTWLVFVSEPVQMQCIADVNGGVRLQVVGWNKDSSTDRELIVRIALFKLCSTGLNPIYCHQERMHPTALLIGQGNYGSQIRKHANVFPGEEASVEYIFDNDGKMATLTFDWDAQDTSKIALHPRFSNETSKELIAFALPHHFDTIVQVPPNDVNIYCVHAIIGPACMYEGSKWDLREHIPSLDFRAPRPPAPWAVPSIARSLVADINFRLPDFYQRGAGDTYFSGKMLAKLGRVLLIWEELEQLCENDLKDKPEYEVACHDASFPDAEAFSTGLAALRSSVEIWINGTADTPFVFDGDWGGVVSCGCLFDGDSGTCRNHFPDCAGFGDPGLNFGNAFYNDQHFHYGYMIYAAAIVAHLDPEWGRNMFEQVLLLVRAIANPSRDDSVFPVWRHKDWFQGNSWASGIAAVYLNGKNQESSSEAIAAYEGVALFGRAMYSAWIKEGRREQANIAIEVEQTGLLLAATEIRSARKYWHIKKDEPIKILPSAYQPRTTGILWQAMAQFQTWFGAAPYLAFGIQLLPLTPASEYRDGPKWAKEMYADFAESCQSDIGCAAGGWSVLQIAMLAVVGHQKMAADMATALPAEAFEAAGGNGHSLTNTLWYIATRPRVASSLELADSLRPPSNTSHDSKARPPGPQVMDCGVPKTCTDYVLDTIAGVYSCRQRMNYLMQEQSKSEIEACTKVAAYENPRECGACNPEMSHIDEGVERLPSCPPCSEEQCRGDLNRCPVYERTFVCSEGPSRGGCSMYPWDDRAQCIECCELTHCTKPDHGVRSKVACPPCSREICGSSVNQCPATSEESQYLCMAGASKGGCAVHPWTVGGEQCLECCSLSPECHQ